MAAGRRKKADSPQQKVGGFLLRAHNRLACHQTVNGDRTQGERMNDNVQDLNAVEEKREKCKKIAARLDTGKAELAKCEQRMKALERELARVQGDAADYEQLVDAANKDICSAYKQIDTLRKSLEQAYVLPCLVGKVLARFGWAQRCAQ